MDVTSAIRKELLERPIPRALLPPPRAIASVKLASGALVTPASPAALSLGATKQQIVRVLPFSLYAQNNPGRTTRSSGPFTGPMFITDLVVEISNGGNVDAGFGVFWNRSQDTQLADSASVTTLPTGTPIFSSREWVHSGVSAFDELKNVFPFDNVVGSTVPGPYSVPLNYLIPDAINTLFLTLTVRNANGTAVAAKGFLRFIENVDPNEISF